MKQSVPLKILSGFLLVTLLWSSYPTQTYAQSGGGAFSGNAQGGFGLSGVAGVAAQCFGLGNMITQGLSAIGDALGNLFGGGSGDAEGGTEQAGTITDAASAMGQEVPTKDKTTQGNTKKTTNELKTNNKKEQCLDAIARYAVLKIIDKITLMTVEWINSGFQGNPFYPENKPNFFENLAKGEIVTGVCRFMGGSCENIDLENYPFGQIIAETILLSVENRLEDNLRLSLNQVLQHSNQYANYSNFNAQFSVGGWAGYAALTQSNNNVFGSYLMANQYFAGQTRGTNLTITENFKTQLDEGSGLVNQRECAKTAASDSYYTSGDEYIDPTNPLHLSGWPLIPQGGTMTGTIYSSLPAEVQDHLDAQNGTDAQAVEYNAIVKRSTCLEWRTVTPGRFLADQTTQVLGSPLRNLELGDELNENLGLIFDALAAQLFKKLGGGLRSLYNSNSDYSSDPNAPNYNAVWAQTQNPDAGGSSGNVPVTTIINGNTVDPGIVTIQQDYLVAASQMYTVLSTLIRDIRTLDYCVPGPQPNWYSEATSNLQNLINNIPESNAFSIDDRQTYYANAIENITGINLIPQMLPGAALSNYSDFLSFINYVFTAYNNEMLSDYPTQVPPPSVRPIAITFFNQIPEHEADMQTLSAQIGTITNLMPQLVSIQNQITALGPNPDPNSPEMQTIASLFNQINSQGVLVNGTQLDQLEANILLYQSHIATVNSHITQCINELTGAGVLPPYTAPGERVAYPYPSISDNPLFGNIPDPVNLFLNAHVFNDNGNTLDVSEWNDYSLNIPNTSTATFASNLGAIY